MINGAYICSGVDLNDKSVGVAKKINKQIEIFNSIGNVELILFNNELEGTWSKIKFLIPFLTSNYEKRMISFNNNKIKWSKLDYVYIRKITFCKGFIEMLKLIRKSNPYIKILLEVPTYPIDGEYSGVKILMKYFNSIYIYKLKKYINYIITFSKDNSIWDIPTIQISNGVDFQNIKVSQRNYNRGLNMIAVAKFNFWHGYDRVIKGLYKYYKMQNELKVYLYLVGDGDILSDYWDQVKQYNLENYVFFTGVKYGKDLENLYKKADIALDAMGRHRSGVYYNSSLKGKEYGAKGLPIVSGVITELDYYSSFEYYYRVPADDSPVDINKIIEFYKKIQKKPCDDVIKEIREFNQEKFDYRVVFNPVIEVLKSDIKNTE